MAAAERSVEADKAASVAALAAPRFMIGLTGALGGKQSPRCTTSSISAVTISDTDRIDIIATRPGSAEVRLIIADHLDWAHVNDHALQLQEKINVYLAFIESGQVQRRPEVASIESPEVWIWVRGLYEPPAEAEPFLARVEEFLASVGVRFRFDHRPTDGSELEA